MKGYLYIDFDNNFVHKTKEYIDNENPMFWSDNTHIIYKAFPFDTDDAESVKFAFKKAQEFGIKPHQLKEMAGQINFDLTKITSK